MNKSNFGQSAYYLGADQKKNINYQDPRYAKYEKYGDPEQLEAEIERDAVLMFKKQQIDRIEGLTGYYEYMRPDFPAQVYYHGEKYQTVAHAYYAAKSNEPLIRKRIQKAPTFQEMYNVAKTIQDPEGWDHKKMKIMENLTRDKFRRNKDLRERLATTQTREIINVLNEKNEENLFWGIVGKNGQNQLGRILEKIRQSIQDESELEQWLQNNFKLVESRKILPSINLEVEKDGQLIETVTLDGKSFYIFGAHPKKCDVILRHPSISRVHSSIVIDQEQGVLLIDLMSKAGTKLDDKQIEGCVPTQLKNDQKIVFGLSTRVYQVKIDYTKMQRAVESEKKNLEREMKILERLDNPNIDQDTLKTTLGLIKEDTIYVSNLPYSCTEKDLSELFGDCGKILSIRIPENPQTKQNKGFAFLTFESEKGCRKALNYSGHMFYDRKLKITKAQKRADIEEKRLRKEESKKGDVREEDIRRDFKERHKRSGRDRSRSRSRDRKDRYKYRNKKEKRRRRHSSSSQEEYRRKRKRSKSSSNSSSSSQSSNKSQSSQSSGFEDNENKMGNQQQQELS